MIAAEPIPTGRRAVGTSLLAVLMALTAPLLSANQWSLEWEPGPDESAVLRTEICPLKFGKTWAYSVEIDDGATSTLTVAEPLLKRFEFTDAPPGVAGGRVRPFVGGAAIMMIRAATTNDGYMGIDRLKELENRGWSVINHSYWHAGNHWNPKERLPPEQFRRELFWSQALLAALVWNGRSDTHFVYPNGDYNYREYLKEFGIRSASGGGSTRSVNGPAESFLGLARNWLDQGRWASVGDALFGLPAGEPEQGGFIIDFTHKIDGDPASDNHRRWTQRLEHIASKFGKDGSDTMWCAPTAEVVNYALASREAVVEARRGRLSVTLPPSAPGSALTIKLTGLSAKSRFSVPEGVTIHRRGTEAWITTPMLGQRGAEPPLPRIKRIYEGPVTNVTLSAATPIAGVRLQQAGKPVGDRIDITLVRPDGSTVALIPEGKRTIKPAWGIWLLYPTVPDGPAVVAKEVVVAGDPSLKSMEIWAVDEHGAPSTAQGEMKNVTAISLVHTEAKKK